MKKNILFSGLTILSLITALVGTAVSRSVEGYDFSSSVLLVALLAVAIALTIGALVLSFRKGAQNLYVTVVKLVAFGLVAFAFTSLVTARATLAAAQFTYDSVNALGWQALNWSIVALVGCLLSEIFFSVGAFFGDKKEN